MSALVANAFSLCSLVGLASDDQQFQINYEHEVYGKKIMVVIIIIIINPGQFKTQCLSKNRQVILIFV